MCIAIVKKAGISIPEDHLYRGWLNNNDGAGFCCIDENGEFIIKKFMTYTGFLKEYKVAEKMYGETSDFLIHFRITSKGTTTIENCHPFQVDRDRVIIHNGTMSAVAIPKNDDRSDTAVFAQDYLPHLPADWEDNATLMEIMEEFIGYSKICMLHRTKGIYILNEARGHWLDGIWYSNDSYKERGGVVVYGWSNEHATGFYSYTLNRWVTPAEAKMMNHAAIAEHRKFRQPVITPSNSVGDDFRNWDNDGDLYDKVETYKACDNCSTVCYSAELTELTMPDMYVEYWCDDCLATLLTCTHCEKLHDESEVTEYWNYTTGEEMILCKDCYDFIAETTKDELVSIGSLYEKDTINK